MKKNVIYRCIMVISLCMILVGCGMTTDYKKITLNLELEKEQHNLLNHTKDSTEDVKKVGVSMPTKSSERWINDGINMKAKLELLGYEVDLQYANDIIETQVSQIESMILNEVNCLVIASVDSSALVDVLKLAKEKGIAVIAYDRLLMDTDAVSYYATFDNKETGTRIGEAIEQQKNLKNAKAEGRSYTIEFFMGSPDDNNALFLYQGAMEVLGPYLESGVLRCKSGKISFEDTCILRWSLETAKERCREYLNEFYVDEKLDIICSAFDQFSYGAKASLLENGYSLENDWPLITGQDAELTALQNIIGEYQYMTIYKDSRILAQKCVTMVQAVLENGTPEINDTTKYDNGKLIVPSYLCENQVITKENYKELLMDSGYYTQLQLE